MNSLPLILARLTVSGLAIISLLTLWFFVKRSSEATSGIQRRRFRRHSILLPVEVDGKEGVMGLTDNLSLGGCRMNGNRAVRRGQHLTLRLRLPGQEFPIIVERAAVRWVVENDFGPAVHVYTLSRARTSGKIAAVGGVTGR